MTQVVTLTQQQLQRNNLIGYTKAATRAQEQGHTLAHALGWDAHREVAALRHSDVIAAQVHRHGNTAVSSTDQGPSQQNRVHQ